MTPCEAWHRHPEPARYLVHQPGVGRTLPLCAVHARALAPDGFWIVKEIAR